MKNGRSRFKNMFYRVYAACAGLIVLFALLISTVFIRLYRSSTQRTYSEQLQRVAVKTVEQCRNYILDEDIMEYMSVLTTVSELENIEIWVIANHRASVPLSEEFVTVNLENIELQEDFGEMLSRVFSGNTLLEPFRSGRRDSTLLVSAQPITGGNREICAAMIIIKSLAQMDETIHDCLSLVVVSSLVALLISGIVAAFLARRITLPIKQMQQMARELMKGNYDCKTGIEREDEIGEMARSIDMLSDKLGENEIERRNIEQMRLDFFANVSHELRTPIAVVRAYTESLVDGVVSSEEQIAQYYGRILRECKSMERLVADLLTLSKMQNPNFKVEKEPVNLVHVIDDIIKGASAISSEKGIEIIVNRDRDVYMMMGDYDRLRQMFMVIFDNAIKFSEEGSHIYVTMSAEDRLRVSIRDEGVGISKEELPNIFEKFYKSKLRQNAKGTGLGLAIAKYIALKHDGEIKVESEVGKGTEFSFYFREISEEDYLFSES